jgi:hypothetical protein
VSVEWLRARGLTQDFPAQSSSVISHPVQSAASASSPPPPRTRRHTHLSPLSNPGPQLAGRKAPSQRLHQLQPGHPQLHTQPDTKTTRDTDTPPRNQPNKKHPDVHSLAAHTALRNMAEKPGCGHARVRAPAAARGLLVIGSSMCQSHCWALRTCVISRP